MSAASSRPNHAHQHFRGQARPKRAVELIIEEVRRLSLSRFIVQLRLVYALVICLSPVCKNRRSRVEIEILRGSNVRLRLYMYLLLTIVFMCT